MSETDFKKRALLAIETLRGRVRELEGAAREPIAIVGYAARFPGAPDADAYWTLLREGRDATGPIPPDRWDADAFYDANPDAAGKMLTRRAGFIDDISGFDAQFFAVAPREAEFMDPQHRLLLETTWHALEHAGVAAADLAGTRTGVFMGLSTHDYLGLLSGKLSYGAIEAYFATGTSPAAAAGRISFRLGLEGPAVTVDTACSSSLVALHQAAQALRLGECDVALSGGVNAILTPATMINFSRARMLAPDGRCKTFDASADGYVRGEGCGVVVLKRLSDAVRDGDRIRAVLRGSAVDQDGASGGLTVPNGRAQQRVIADALHQAGLTPGEIDYLEAHGTGTSLGDPIEVQAAGAAFGGPRTQPLWIGSVKTNIGHLEAAAGVAGVIKVVLSLEHELLPKHLHFKTPSPHIPWGRLPVAVVREAQAWPRNDRPRLAGISSFGFSGTNAHVLIEEAPALDPASPGAPRTDASGDEVGEAVAEPRPLVLPLSARTADALHAVASAYAGWLDDAGPRALADLCYTAGVGRSHLEHRAALVVETAAQARERLTALAEERPAPGVWRGVSADPPKTAWLFTGQGSQYSGMARGLYETEPVFRATLDECATVLEGELQQPLLDVLFAPDGPLGQTAYTQPALFAVEMGLARLWEHWGLTPDVVLGHSVGQYSAACVAGVFSMESGLRLLAARGRLMGALPAGGRMAAVFTESGRVDAQLAAHPTLSVAAYNGAHTVVSGPAAAVEAVVAGFEAAGVRCAWLDTSHAFHSALLDPALDAFEAVAQTVTHQPLTRTLICNRTGKVLSGQTLLDGAYWRRHARQPVRFAESVATLATLGCKVLLEVGPQPVLTAMALRAWPDGRPVPTAIPSLRRDVADGRQMREALAQLYVAGSRPRFAAVDETHPRAKVDLPLYPFQHRRFWFKATRSPAQNESSAPSEALKLLEQGQIEELAGRLNRRNDGGDDEPATQRVLQKLYDHHQRERFSQSTAENLYEISWQKLASPAARAPLAEGRHWLIVSSDGDEAQALVDLLKVNRQQCTLIALPSADDKHASWLKEFSTIVSRQAPFRIVHVASVGLADETSDGTLDSMQHTVLAGTRSLLQAAIELNLKAPIWFVTRGAQAVLDSDHMSPAQTCLWGFGRVVALEHPELWGGLIDLPSIGLTSNGPASIAPREWQDCVFAIAGETGEDQIAVRSEAAYVPRLKRRQAAPVEETLALREDATYLITGGLGALGLEAASFLAANGARHIVLTSRRSPGDRAHEKLEAFRDRHEHCQIRVVPADVSSASEVQRLLTIIGESLPPLAGVVHAAGEIGSGRISALSDAEIAGVFSGKVWGAWRLTTALAGTPLDFFISFSSIASVWGSFGQAAYAAANAFLDGLASFQRRSGVRGTAVNFGPWSSGMADEQAREQLAKRGIQQLTPDLALAGMKSLAGSAQGVVARVEWATFLPVYQLQAKRPFMKELDREHPTRAADAADEKSSLVQRIVQAPAAERKRMLHEYLRNAVAETVRLDPEQIRDEAGFFDLGMDSLMAIELRKRLEKDIGQPLPATIAIDYPRLSDAADFLLTKLGLQAEAKAQTDGRAAVTAGDPVAVIGLACRFPGAGNREAFWDLLANGVDAIREVPGDRFDINEFYDPDPETPGKIYTRYGGFLERIEDFDAEFFGVSPREAVWIDPQQRLMLETSWEGLEDAGLAPASLARTRTGVFVGVGANEYSHLLAGAPEDIDAYFITGNALNVIAGRVAFSLGFEGPAVTVDTACSSSLVALHQAAQALRLGECDVAIAGGVNVLLSPATSIAACRARMLSPEGRCKTFDASADGYVRSEGCGVVVLKRLSDAVRDGDRIRAVIRGSAVNQDGASSGLTVPSGRAQQRVIGDALHQAGLQPAEIDYLEAHGTGTSLGDPIEIQAAGAVFGTAPRAQPLWVGSVKTNIGHLESASGIAGVIKVVLSLEHELLPRHLHFDTPSPHIPWDQLPVAVVHAAQPWRRTSRPRRAGVSSFGFSGTNAHVLIEEAPAPTVEAPADAEPVSAALTSEALDMPVPDVSDAETSRPATGADLAPETAGAPALAVESTAAPAAPRTYVLPVSARTEEALRAMAARYAAWFGGADPTALADGCYTAGVGRSHLEHRAAVVVETGAQAQERLTALAEDRPVPGVWRGVSADPPKTAWLFTGQGSQYPGMARALYESEPVFRATLDACAAALAAELPRPLLEVLFASDGPLGQTAYTQPALFAVEMSLARLWEAWGLTPDVVLGHSVGEYTAACVAGVFSLEDGLRLLAARGRLMGALPAGGRMAAVFADAGQVEARVAAAPTVSVAAYNGAHTVVSGPGPAVEALVAEFETAGVRCAWLDTSHAFHSALLEPALDAFEAVAQTVAYQPVTRTLVSNRTGKVVTGQTVLDAAYWRRHARQPVQFAESVATLATLGCKVLLEVGPQPVLTAMALRAWPEGRPTPAAVASLRRDVPDGRQLREALAQLYVAGSRPHWAALDATRPHAKVDLPSYAFQRRRFWPKTDGLRMDDPQARGLLGSRRDLASGDVVYSSRFGIKHLPWLADHIIYGTVVVPGATYAAMAMMAAGTPAELQDVFFYEPIVFSGNESRDVQLTLHTAEDAAPGVRTFQVHSRPQDDREATWSLNCSGTLVADGEHAPDLTESVDTIIERLSPMRPQQLFDGFAENELKWGPTWSSSLRSVWAGGAEAVGEIVVGDDLGAHLAGEPMHPVLLDLCTGIAGASLLAARPDTDEEVSLYLPLKYEGVTLREQTPRRFFCYAKWQDGGAQSETQTFDLHFISTDGRYIGGIRHFIVKRAPRQALLRGLGVDSGRLLYRITWRESPIAAPEADAVTDGTWLVVGPDNASTAALRRGLALRKQRAVHVEIGDTLTPIAEDRAAIDPGVPEHWETLFASIRDRGETLVGVVWHVERTAGSVDVESADHMRGRLEHDLNGVLNAVRHLLRNDRTPLARGLWIVTEHGVAAEPSEDVDPVHAAFWGLGRTIAAEQPSVRCTLVDHDGTSDALHLLEDVLLTGAPEPELALRQRKALVPRVMPWVRSGQLALPASEDYRLRPTERGAIDNLHLAPETIAPPDPGYVQVRVEAAGLNFRDILNVLGLYPGDPGEIGGELAGVVTAIGAGVDEFEIGDRVFGFSPGGGFASRANVPFPFLVRQPARVSSVEAVTTPATVLTAALGFEWAKPKPGERVLIHAATGGVGLAAVQLARNCGAIVYATASQPKQRLLREMGVEHIYDSRTTAFADQILADTGGAGVDVVLNSLTNEGFVDATVRATARGGRFVEIAKVNIWSPETMVAARPDIDYHILALDEIMQRDPMRIQGLLTDLAAKLETGELSPLLYMAYPVTEAKAAFRRMQQARHMGKIVLRMPGSLKAQRDRTYLVTGGLGALGLATAAYLAQMGAGHLVLTGRRAPDQAAQGAIAAIESQFHSEVHVIAADVSREADVANLLAGIRRDLPPLAGVAHLAGVIDDALIPDQSIDKVRTVLAPKALGAWHLHRLTKDDALDFFLLYSSASSVLGSPGQANYAAANALLDGLAAHRQAHGLPSTSVNWGPWADVGMAASVAARANLGKQGLIPLKPAAALAALSEVVGHGTVQATVINANWQRAAKLFGPTRPPMLEHVLPKAATAQAVDQALLRQLQQVPPGQRGDFLTEHLQRELQQILGLAQPPAPASKFLELGMDSLMAVELRNRLLGQFGSAFTISSTVVFDYPTIRALAEYLAEQTPASAAVPAAPVAQAVAAPLPTVEELRASVSALMEKLKPFHEMGISLQIGSNGAAGGDAAALEQAILEREANAAALEILADVTLPDDLLPVRGAAAPSPRGHAVLTGATGYLGGHVLRELLAAGTTVTCIVRCQTSSAGVKRVVSNLEEMRIWKPELAERLRVVPGEIGRPLLGLSREAFEALADEVDSIFHCAASVELGPAYGHVRQSNVMGTRHVIELMGLGAPKVLHLVSSDAVFMAPQFWRQEGVAETVFPESPEGNVLGYGQSKWAAESLVRTIMARGGRAVIYRPGAILGSATTGYWSPGNLATKYTAHALATGTVSGTGRILEGVPVDIVARYIVACSTDAGSFGRTFHITHPRPLDVAAWAEALTHRGKHAQSVSEDVWVQGFAAENRDNGLRPLFAARGVGVNLTIMECLRQMPGLDGRSFHHQLGSYGIGCSAHDELLGGGWLDVFPGPATLAPQA